MMLITNSGSLSLYLEWNIMWVAEKVDILITRNTDGGGPEIRLCIFRQSLPSNSTSQPSKEFLFVLWALSLFTWDFWDTTFLVCMISRSSLEKINVKLVYLLLRQL